MSGFARAARWTALALLGAGACSAPVHAAAPAPQPTVALLHDRIARVAPDAGARKIATVAARRPLTRVRTVLPVVGVAKSGDGAYWLRVLLPGRPNGHAGWIPAVQIKLGATEWRITVDLSLRRVSVRRDGREVRRFRAAIGTPATPTPTGRFFIEEALSLSPREKGGPFALATSARSSVLQQFAGGPGQIALHGTNNLETVPGSAVSHGCIRLSTGAITWLARRIRAGVPLTITR